MIPVLENDLKWHLSQFFNWRYYGSGISKQLKTKIKLTFGFCWSKDHYLPDPSSIKTSRHTLHGLKDVDAATNNCAPLIHRPDHWPIHRITFWTHYFHSRTQQKWTRPMISRHNNVQGDMPIQGNIMKYLLFIKYSGWVTLFKTTYAYSERYATFSYQHPRLLQTFLAAQCFSSHNRNGNSNSSKSDWCMGEKALVKTRVSIK